MLTQEIEKFPYLALALALAFVLAFNLRFKRVNRENTKVGTQGARKVKTFSKVLPAILTLLIAERESKRFPVVISVSGRTNI